MATDGMVSNKLKNNVHFAGALAELSELKKGISPDGTPNISFNGVIQCGETAVYNRNFKVFAKAKNSKGEDNQVYKNMLSWYKEAVPMTKDKVKCTMVDFGGSVNAFDYVGKDGTLHESLTYNMSFINEFKDYACYIDMDGYISSITDEMRGQGDDKTPTGRKVMSLLTMDFYHNVLQMKKIFIPAEFVDQLEDNGYEKGRTVHAFFSYKPANTNAAPKRRTFGEVPTTSGASFLELVFTGGEIAYDEDGTQSITPATANSMMKERINHLKEIEAKGYQGGSSGGGSSSTTSGTGAFKVIETPLTDDDIPF